jgi:hypothetical protein
MNARITLAIPSEDLSVRGLTSVLRVFELLIALRAISPSGELAGTWAVLYREYVQSVFASAARRGPFLWIDISGHFIGAQPSDIDLDAENGTDSSLFESWLAAEFVGMELLPIEDIRHGSYELVLQTINLAAVFGLQDFALTKDLVQCVVGAIRDLLEKQDGKEHPVRSGKATVRVSPELIRALQPFDDVSITEERTAEGTILKLRLLKKGGR